MFIGHIELGNFSHGSLLCRRVQAGDVSRLPAFSTAPLTFGFHHRFFARDV
jgi:hypothetical protein